MWEASARQEDDYLISQVELPGLEVRRANLPDKS
jgi:hypothetical protein